MKALYSRDEFRGENADPPPTWHRAERFVREEYDLIKDHSSWHDARTRDGEPIEIKSCAAEYTDGRVGQFKIFDFQRTSLFLRGRVALLIYFPAPPYRVLATRIVEPCVLAGKGTTVKISEPYAPIRWLQCIPWTELLSLDALEFAYRHLYANHFTAEEVEETLLLHPPEEAD